MRSLRESLASHFTQLTSSEALSRRLAAILIALILISFALVRLAWIDAPALDRTAWKEIDYLMISQGYRDNGFRFFYPEVWWPAEEPRVTAMELPLVPFLSGLLYTLFGFHPLTARLTTFCSFLLMSFYVYRLGKRELGPIVGLGGALFSGFMALGHEFGNFQFSEPPMIALSVAAVFHYAQWLEHGRGRDRVIALCAFSLAVALKLTPLYLLLPLAYLQWARGRDQPHPARGFALFVGLALVMPALWYAWAYYLGTRFIDVFGIFGGHDKMQTLTMLSDPDWYRTLFDRVAWGMLAGKAGLLLSVIGIATVLAVRRGRLLLAYLAAILIFFALVAEGHIDAPYRQLTIVPPLSLLAAAGIVATLALGWAVLDRVTGPRLSGGARSALSVALSLLVVTGLYLRRPLARHDPESPIWGSRWQLAQVIRAHTREGDRLVLAGEYSIHVGGNDLSPVLYYFSGRRGWTLQEGDWSLERVHELAERGATFLLATDMHREPAAEPFLADVKKSYPVIWEDDESADFAVDLRSGAGATEPEPR